MWRWQQYSARRGKQARVSDEVLAGGSSTTAEGPARSNTSSVGGGGIKMVEGINSSVAVATVEAERLPGRQLATAKRKTRTRPN